MGNKRDTIHEIQLIILRQLAVTPTKRFNELLVKKYESEHMNYHLQQLMVKGYVTKKDLHYTLTDSGKDFTNLLDDDMQKVEKQPKTGVIIRAARKNPRIGILEDLLCKRLRQPYYGKVGRIGGKVQFGEKLEEAARRELHEESGLYAAKVTLEQIYHKVRHRKDGTCVQDVLFYIFFAEDLSGTLITHNQYQENFWVTQSDVLKNMDPYDDLEFSDTLEPRHLTFVEEVLEAEGY